MSGPKLIGQQSPTLRLRPEYSETEGDLAISFARSVGYDLFPWQELLIRDGLSLDPERRLAASAILGVVSRQNGKSLIAEVIVLYGLFVARYRKVLYTAHKAKTAKETFEAIQGVINDSPMLQRQLDDSGRTKGIFTGNGNWEIKLKTGESATFQTRTNQGGRGQRAIPLLVVDEVQDYTEQQQASYQPTVSSAKNPQIWYLGSAGGQHSTVMGTLVRSMQSGAERMVYHGYHADEDDDPNAVETWAKANPSLGAILEVDTVRSEAGQYSPHYFGRERLGIGDYPRPPGEEWVIPKPKWEQRCDALSDWSGPAVFVAEGSADFEWGSIAVAGRRADGDVHIEVVKRDRGTAWMPGALRSLQEQHDTLGIAVDPKSPTAPALLAELGALTARKAITCPVVEMDFEHVKSAFSWIYTTAKLTDDEVKAYGYPRFWHRGSEILTQSLAVAQVRLVGDHTLWSRKGEDTSAIIAATNAGWMLQVLERAKKKPPPVPSGGGAGSNRELRPTRAGSVTGDLSTMKF